MEVCKRLTQAVSSQHTNSIHKMLINAIKRHETRENEASNRHLQGQRCVPSLTSSSEWEAHRFPNFTADVEGVDVGGADVADVAGADAEEVGRRCRRRASVQTSLTFASVR